MQNRQPATIGVDVSKDTLDAAVLFTDNSYAEAQFSNNTKGIKKFLAWAKKRRASQCPICVEATGGLELDLCIDGYDAKHPIRVEAPALIANFRKSLNLRNKTDGVDARLIARFAYAIPTGNYWQKPSQAVIALRDALKSRRQLIQCHTDLGNSIRTLRNAEQKRIMTASLKHLKKQIDKIDATMEAIINQDEQLTQLYQLLRSIPGVGLQTAAILCAVLDTNTFENPKQLAAYIGITPRVKQSGNSEAQTRITKTGDAHLRRAIFMASLSARRYNQIIREFADQLSRCRPELTKKQVIVACARKLAQIIYGVVKNNKPFDPHHECPAAS